MKHTNRFKKTHTYVPFDLLGADALLEDIGDYQSAINAIEDELDANIEALRNETEQQLTKLKERQHNACIAVFAFAEKEKARLTLEAKSVATKHGVFGWRTTTPKVDLTVTLEEAIRNLKAGRKKRFVRVKESLDKGLLLKEKPNVPGVQYLQKEEFFIKPNAIENGKKSITLTIDE